MTPESKSKSGEYWKQHVMSWEASAYFKDSGKLPTFWDRMSTSSADKACMSAWTRR